MNERGWLLVGVDGSDGSDAAIRYAAFEAKRLGVGVRLVHVAPDYVSVAPLYPMTYSMPEVEIRQIGEKILRRAARVARNILPAARVTTALLSGNRAASLVEAARDARLTVLGDARRPVVDRMLTGSTIAGVAAHSATPVVAVPSTWTPLDARGRVVAAVKACDSSEGLVHRALQVASGRKARLVLLHAWQLPAEYDDMVVSRIDAQVWADDSRRALEKLLEPLRAEFPGVEVEVRVEHGQPARILAAATEEADLLLIARRGHVFPVGYLGGVGRTVLAASRCPVEVLPPAGEPDGLAGLVLEENGVFEKAEVGGAGPGRKSSAPGDK